MPVPKLAILVPTNSVGPLPTSAEYARFFSRAEELGFHSLWVIDRLAHERVNMLAPLTIATWAAALTSRIEIGLGVLLANLWGSPVAIAKQLASLDVLSGGRLWAGVSLGGRPEEYQAVGVPISQRLGRMIELIEIARKVWREDHVSFSGKYYQFEDITLNPKPVREGGLPLIIGTGAPDGVRRAGRIGDGWIIGAAPGPDVIRQGYERFAEGARSVGKDPASMEVIKELYTYVDSSEQVAWDHLTPYCHGYYGPQWDVEANTAAGPPEKIVERIKALGEAGVTTVLLGPPRPDVEQLELIANEVAPALA